WWVAGGPRRAWGAPLPEAAGELDVVALEPHARAAPEPETASSQLGRDLVDRDGQAGRESFDHDRQGRAVRLPRGQVAQQFASVFAAPRIGRRLRSRGGW